MSTPSLANFIRKRPALLRWIQPIADWYADAAGYRKLGLRYGSIALRSRKMPIFQQYMLMCVEFAIGIATDSTTWVGLMISFLRKTIPYFWH